MLPIAVRIGTALASAAPGVISRVASRIGVMPTVKAIVSAISNNKLLAGYAAFELFGATDIDVLALLSDEIVGQSIEALISSIEYTADSADASLEKLNDEFQLIENAARIVGGGIDNLLQLRNALRLDDSIYNRHREITSLGYRR